MNSSVFGVATPCLRPSTNLWKRLLIELAISWLTRTDLFWLLMIKPNGRDFERDAAAEDAAARGERGIVFGIS